MPRVGRWGTGAFLTAPWLRAPFLSFSQPAVVAAVAGAVLVLAAAAAAQPLFVSSAANRALATQLAERCEWATGGTLDVPGPAAGFGNALAAEAARIPRVGDPVRTAITPAVNASLVEGATAEETVFVQLVARTGAAGHVEVVDGEPGLANPGLLVADTTRDQLGLAVGDTLTLEFSGVVTTAPVVGVYRDLIDVQPLPSWWCSLQSHILPAGDADPRGRPPPLAVADRGTYDRLAATLDLSQAAIYELPLDRDGITLGEAAAVVDAFERLPARLQDATGLETITPDHFRPATGGIQTGEHFPEVRGNLPFVVDRSAAIATSLRGAVEPVALAGVLAAGLLVVAAGSYWVDRRRGEVQMLVARGVGPGALAVKAGVYVTLTR